MNNQEIEAEIQAKGLTAPRITEADVDAAIVRSQYHVFEGSQLTVCCLTLRNGFTVTGESACASPENFDAELGRKIAYRNAHSKVWQLEAYLLKQRLSEHAAMTNDAQKLKEYWASKNPGLSPDQIAADDAPFGDRSTDGIAAAVEGATENLA